MDENKVKKLIEQELNKREAKQRFGRQNVPNHVHDGGESPKIRDLDIDRNPGVIGSVTFSTVGQEYTFRLNMPQTPRMVYCNGIVYDTNRRILTNGIAYLGKGYYLQPDTSSSVVVGDLPYPAATEQPDGSTKNVPIQGSSWLWADKSNGADYKAAVSENHIVSVGFSGTIYARVTVVDFSKDKVVFSVPYLESGYEVIANFLIV